MPFDFLSDVKDVICFLTKKKLNREKGATDSCPQTAK